MLVALDSNVVDLVWRACDTNAHLDAMEAMEPPPDFGGDWDPKQEAEVFACYWLLAMAPAWTSTIYTFSDFLFDEIARAAKARVLRRVTLDVLVRDWQQPSHRSPDPTRTPDLSELMSFGLKRADAIHVADAIGLGCDRLLTNDKQLRNRCADANWRWPILFRRPSEFLVDAVRNGAPWSARAPWPWESIEAIHSEHNPR